MWLRSSKNHKYNMRFHSLLNATDKRIPVATPTDCLDLLLRHTPAQRYWTRLKININRPVKATLGNGRLIRALQYAKGLLLLEVQLQIYVTEIMEFVRQLGHIQTIKLSSRSGKEEVYAKEMALRNANWKETSQQDENSGGLNAEPEETLQQYENSRVATPGPEWMVIRVVCR